MIKTHKGAIKSMVYDPNCWMPGDGSFENWKLRREYEANPNAIEPKEPEKWLDYHVGVDIGQKHDYTALAVTECRPNYAGDKFYFVRYLHRFRLGLLFGTVVQKLASLDRQLRASGGSRSVSITWACDATGIGSPVVEMIQKALPEATVVPVYITGGFGSTVDYDESHISKQQLVSLIVAAFESGSVRIADDVKEAETLIQELSNYELRRSESGHVSYGAMTGGAFDDLVTSLGLSLFSAVTWGSSSQVLFW